MFKGLFGGKRGGATSPQEGPQTELEPETPRNELEAMLFAAMRQQASMDDFLTMLIASKLNVPSSTEVQQDGSGLNPIFYDRNGVSMAVAYTEISRITREHQAVANYCLQTDASWLIKQMNPRVGMVIFSAPGRGCELLPEALADLRRRL